jgi:hypothetical protein
MLTAFLGQASQILIQIIFTIYHYSISQDTFKCQPPLIKNHNWAIWKVEIGQNTDHYHYHN